MSHIPRQHPPFRRFSQVYVEIPPSLLSPTRDDTIASITYVPPSSSSLKENAPLWKSENSAHPNAVPGSTSISHKRKLSDRDPSLSMVEVVITKKPRQFINATTCKTKELNARVNIDVGGTTTSTQFPNGHTYCHQCAKKRDAEGVIYCTVMESHNNGREQTTTERRCKTRYCAPCLKNRYGEDANDIKATVISKKAKGHVHDQGYIFKCPKCRDICNCARCRKAKGLQPTGNMHLAASKAAAADVNPKAAGAADKAVIRTVDGTGPQAALARKLEPKPKALAKPIPVPKWTGIPAAISLTDGESRILIREFVIRFAQLMGIARVHVEELENVGGRGKGQEGDEELCGWVSEPCVRAVILGLLKLLADDQVARAAKIIKDAMKDIRGSGANLNRMWGILASMRDSFSGSTPRSNSSTTSSRSSTPDGFVGLTFPDPLPPSASSTIRHTRNTRNGPGTNINTYVTDSAQMVPLLEALTETALGTAVVREEIEAGVKQGKERVKELREIVKKENERWDIERKGNEEIDTVGPKKMKTERKTHKQTLQDLDHALRVVMSAYAPRFGPLGRDNDGRVYWALSPGVVERERASEFIAGTGRETGRTVKSNWSRKGKGRGLGRIRGTDERSEMKEWSWFIGVWGKRPPLVSGTEKVAVKRAADDDAEDTASDSDDEDEDKWWGFWEPEEIKRVAGWIAGTSGLAHGNEKDEVSSRALSPSFEPSTDDEAQSFDENADGMDVGGRPTRHELRALVKGLDEYAGVLGWRVKGQEGDLNEEDIKEL